MQTSELHKLQQLVEKHIADSNKSIPDQIAKESRAAINSLRILIETNAKNAARSQGDIQLELLEMKHAKWHDIRVYTNALRVSKDMLEISLSINNSYDISRALDRLQNDLVLILKDSRKSVPDADDVQNIIKTLDKVGAEHMILISSIKEMLAKVRSNTT